MRWVVLLVSSAVASACMFASDDVFLGRAGGGQNGPSTAAPDPSHPGCNPTDMSTDAPVEPARPPPALSGGNLGVMADGTVVVGDSDRDRVWVFPPTLDRYVEIPLQPGDEPGRVVEGPSRHVFVALRRAGQVAEVAVDAATVVARHDACSVPRGVAWNAATHVLYVACGEGVLIELTDLDGTITQRTVVPVADDLRDVAQVGDAVWVSTFRSGAVFEVGALGDVRELHWPPPSSPLDVARGPLDLGLAWRMIPDPSGALFVRQVASKEATGDPCSTPQPLYSGGGVVAPVTSRATFLRSMGGQSVDVADLSDALAGAVLPVDIAEGANGEIAVAAAGDSSVFVIENGAITRVPIGVMPTAVGFTGHTLVAFTREPAELVAVTNATTQFQVILTTTSVASTAFDLFHGATPAQIACASCHPEAGEDGNVWTLPEGRVRTPTLRGGISATAPFHWLGEETTLDQLMFDIFAVRMGGQVQSPDRTAALARWLDAQSARPRPSLDPLAVGRGASIFESPETGCTSCHVGQLGTNNTSVNVGTGERLQVPRLVELAYRAPYLHDGRATTLRNRFGAIGGGDQHGHTSHLSPEEIDDLVTYLRSR
jgi:hypothetical protein